jgi:hypothetical protein
MDSSLDPCTAVERCRVVCPPPVQTLRVSCPHRSCQARILISNYARRHACGGRSIRNIVKDYGVRTNARMVTYRDRPQDLRSRANVYMTTDSRHATVIGTDGDLLEQEAIRADFGVRMNDDSVRMRQQQTAAQLAIERNVGACHHAPISMPQYCANPWQ